jgi:regulatory protein
MIRNKLKERGVHPSHIESALSTYDAMDILDRQIEKKIQAKTQKPKAQLVRTLRTYFMQKGYTLETVDHALQKYQHLYQGDEMALIIKDYQKLEKKYASKLSGYELSETIKQKLYAKGYPYDLIKKVIS